MTPAQTIEHVDLYRSLYTEILDLFETCGPPWSITAHPAWVDAWWSSRPADRPLECLVVRRHGRLVAAVPIEYHTRFGISKALGTNMAWGWASALVDPTEDCGEDLVESLSRRPWSILELGLFPDDSPAMRTITAAMSRPSWHLSPQTRPIARLDLPATYEQWLAGRSQHLRRKVKRTQLNAGARGVRCHTVVSPPADLLAEIIGTVSQRSWQGEQGLAVYTEPANRDFYRLLSARTDALDIALHVVEGDAGQPLAYMLSVATAGVAHLIDTGYDPAAAGLSPGLLSTLEALHWACGQGIRQVDLGVHMDYKDRYGPTIENGRAVVVTRGPGGALARMRERV